MGTQGRSGRMRKNSTPPPEGFDPRTVQPVASRYPGPHARTMQDINTESNFTKIRRTFFAADTTSQTDVRSSVFYE
jgi:hypothetical protein